MVLASRVQRMVVTMPTYGTAFCSPGKPWQRMQSSKGIRPKAAKVEQVVMTMLEGNKSITLTHLSDIIFFLPGKTALPEIHVTFHNEGKNV